MAAQPLALLPERAGPSRLPALGVLLPEDPWDLLRPEWRPGTPLVRWHVGAVLLLRDALNASLPPILQHPQLAGLEVDDADPR